MKVLKKRAMRSVFGRDRDEVTGDWRKLHFEFRNLYSSSNIIRMIKSTGMK
jgi:hypothetical protein